MRSRNDYSIGTSISSRVTAAHSFAIRTAKMAVVQTPDCTLTLEALRAFAVIIIMSGYCYQYMATVGMHLPMNNQVSILLYNIQNMVTLFFVLAGVVTFLPIARAILKQRPRLYLPRYPIRTIWLASCRACAGSRCWIASSFGDLVVRSTRAMRASRSAA